MEFVGIGPEFYGRPKFFAVSSVIADVFGIFPEELFDDGFLDLSGQLGVAGLFSLQLDVHY
jgi:hypothetical protein